MASNGYVCRVFCCTGTSCSSSGCGEVYTALNEAVQAHNLQSTVAVVPTGCMGLCSRGPLIKVEIENRPPVLYQHVSPLIARLIVVEHIMTVLRETGKSTFTLPEFLSSCSVALDMPFFTLQKQVVLSDSDHINPEKIEDYIGIGGYSALEKALASLTGEDVIRIIRRSGLRGRGGGGFPTALKWESAGNTESREKYVICNADEGDPGAYMDRSILESNPHRVLEGLILAGFAVGAASGFFHIRAEYPLAAQRVEQAILQAHEKGFLGKSILGSDFSFTCDIRVGAGAFVSGEETALIASVEGRRGMPVNRPPFPSERGLWGSPTCINNVETLANVPLILGKGEDWFQSFGNEEAPGTKVFALSGKIKNRGLIEVPMGTPIRTILETMGDGTSSGKKIKAVQIGGLAGGLIPENQFDLPMSYASFQQTDSSIGSGGLIVLDEDDSVVELTRFYTEFAVSESCGKCAPCRIGTSQMLHYLDRILEGEGTMEDIQQLKRISQALQQASLCGLGRSAPNPFLSSYTYFHEEYTSLLKERSLRDD